MVLLVKLLASLNQILTAGIVITAFSLLLYALTFNLRDRGARAFAALLVFVTIAYFGEAVVSTAQSQAEAEAWLRLQWVGIAFIPVAYLHFSDALLASTGQPSRGRRRSAIRILYVMAGVFVVAAALTNLLVKRGAEEASAWHLRAGPLFPVYVFYLLGTLGWVAWNFQRAYARCQTSTARRRMMYLIISSAAPALGTFPFLLLSSQTATLHPFTFWVLAFGVNLVVTILLMVMAYVVAYFGVTQPDRVVKGRLFQWFLRGPVVASTVLMVWVVVARYGPRLSFYDARILPFVLVGAVLLLQFFITLVRLPAERALFYGADAAELRRLQTLEARLLTSGDLRQFLEIVLAGLCDALRTPAAFVAAFGPDGKIDYEVRLGPVPTDLPLATAHRAARFNGAAKNSLTDSIFEWGAYWLVPLKSQTTGETLGLLGVQARATPIDLTPDELNTFSTLADRAAIALEDRRLQAEVFAALDRLLPQIEAIQRLRASASYAGPQALAQAETVIASPDLAQMVKDALSHYWGGPKLTSSPLLSLRVVEQALRDHEGNPANALRGVLAQAIERIRPEGQRKFTTEWVLYNILELKFLQNRRVREVALKLSVSEADLYRKQRFAVEEVARAIVTMEKEAAERATDYDVAG